MKNNIYNKRISLWLYLCLFYSLSFAQSNEGGAVKGTRTDKNFANTTAIYKSEKASDEQVLTEIEGDYGLGDMVRISNAPPATVVLPAPVLPKTVESINRLPNTQILVVSPFKMPKSGDRKGKKEDNSGEKNKENEPLASSNNKENLTNKGITEKQGKESTNEPNEKRITREGKDLVNSPSENKEKLNKDLTDAPSEKLKKSDDIYNPIEKSDKNAPVSSEKKGGNETAKTSRITTDKKKTTALVSTNANKKWMADNLATYNKSSPRTHRSTVTYSPQKKSWFPFFGKKKTSKMPKTVKNKKSDRCYQF
jgi:hypothetical protein